MCGGVGRTCDVAILRMKISLVALPLASSPPATKIEERSFHMEME